MNFEDSPSRPSSGDHPSSFRLVQRTGLVLTVLCGCHQSTTPPVPQSSHDPQALLARFSAEPAYAELRRFRARALTADDDGGRLEIQLWIPAHLSALTEVTGTYPLAYEPHQGTPRIAEITVKAFVAYTKRIDTLLDAARAYAPLREWLEHVSSPSGRIEAPAYGPSELIITGTVVRAAVETAQTAVFRPPSSLRIVSPE